MSAKEKMNRSAGNGRFAGNRQMLGALLVPVVCGCIVASFGATLLALDVIGRSFVLPAGSSKAQTAGIQGASLQTVPEQELFKLRRAKEFAAEGDFRSAIALWQSVLDTAGSQLITRDEWLSSSNRHGYKKFVTVAHEIESILAELSEEGLRAYRFRADGEARALLANPGQQSRAEVLSEVVRRFFLSSEGDEAAFELACLKLDRFEFTGASRLLRKCLDEHPDCSVPREEILLRLAVANSRIGDGDAANNALQQLNKEVQSAASKASDRIRLVASDVNAQGKSSAIPSRARGNWHVKYGSPSRTGVMRGLPANLMEEDLTEVWSQEFDVEQTALKLDPQFARAYGGMRMGGQSVSKTPASGGKIDRTQMVRKWKDSDWLPVGNLLFHEGLLYFKRENRVVCCSAESGEMEWMGLENDFEVPGNPLQKMQLMMMSGIQANNMPSDGKPSQPAEIQLFGDRVYQAMSIGDGNFYSIEGRTWMDPKTVVEPQSRSPYGFSMSLPPRSRENWLTAYDVVNGKLKWRRTARDKEIEDSKFEVGFSAAPVSGGGMMYVTTNDSGSVWLLALDPTTGKTIWKTFLCDEPAGACAQWSPSAIAYDGGDVYVGTGAGLLAAVDGVAGALRWVIRYDRSGKTSKTPNPFGGQLSFGSVTGWREDVLVPNGRALVVMGSDSADIFALDRRTGEILWDSPREVMEDQPADYYLGMRKGRIYVGGRSLVRCYDAIGGRAIWETAIESSLGTGIVTEDAIYVPSGMSMVKLSPDTGKEIGRVKLVSTTQEPVGNLYSDGKRIYAVGMARVYAMMGLQSRIDELDAGVEERDIEAVLARAQFRAFQGKVPETWDDLMLAYEIRKTENPLEATRELLRLIAEYDLASKDPQGTLQRLKALAEEFPASIEVAEAGRPDKQVSTKRMEGLRLQFDEALAQALNRITLERQLFPGVPELFAIAPLCNEDYLVERACVAMQRGATEADEEVLRASLTSDSLTDRRLAVAGIIGLGKGSFDDKFVAIAKNDPSDSLRLRVAIAMLNAEQREAFDVLLGLLTSEDEKVRHVSRAALSFATLQEFEPAAKGDYQSEEYIAAWKTWLAKNRDSAKLKLPFIAKGSAIGRTIVCYLQRGRVVEYEKAGKQTWMLNYNMPSAAFGLPNGHRLIGSMTLKRIEEFDQKGRKVWTQRVPGAVTRIQRLLNDNTLVAMQNPNMVVEYRKDGSTAWKYTASSAVHDARRLENGNTLVVLQDGGKLLCVNPAGETVWKLAGLGAPVSAQPLDNGHFLVTLSGGNRVAEMTRRGKIVWDKRDLQGVTDAQRLANGHTLVASSTSGVQEFDSSGELVDTQLPKPTGSKTVRRTVIRGSYRVQSIDPNTAIFRIHRY